VDDALDARRRTVAEEAARAAGAVHMRYYAKGIDRVTKAWRRDFVTQADLEAQAAVKDVIAAHFPDDLVIGEEDEDAFNRITANYGTGCWVTDPLDGTAEFLHTGTHFASVVSYVEGGVSRAAAIYAPFSDELFSAAPGQGATLNGRMLRTSGATRLDDAMFVASYTAPTPERAGWFARWMERVMPAVGGWRMFGSSALCAMTIAAGRADLYASPREPEHSDPLLGSPHHPQPWETPAYVLIVQEAGGAVSDIHGGPPDLLGFNIYAASHALLEEYLALSSAGPRK
jgi:myo-inositol-1(or 4)-monophosphatase